MTFSFSVDSGKSPPESSNKSQNTLNAYNGVMWNYRNLNQQCKSLHKLLGNDSQIQLGQHLTRMLDAIISIKQIPDLEIDLEIGNPKIFFYFIKDCFSTIQDNPLESEILAYYEELNYYYNIYYNLKKGKQSASKINWPPPIPVTEGSTSHID